MPTPGQPYTKEETLSLVQEKARTSTDRFKLNIMRRTPNGQVSQVAGLDGATYAQIAEPAAWLPPLLGGGQYFIHVSHSIDSPGSRLGSPIEENYDTRPDGPAGAPKNTPSIKVMASNGWPGPPTLFFPSRELIEADQLGKPHPFQGATGQGSLRPTLSAAVVQGGYETPQAVDPNAQGLLAQALAKEADAVRQREENARRERELNERQSKMDKENTEKAEGLKRAESESKLREEMRGRDEVLKAQIAQLTAAAQRPVEQPKGPSVIEIVTALSPLAQMFMTMQQETARANRESAEKLAQIQREASERSAALQLEILKSLTVKPGMSPEMGLLIETLKEDKKSSSADAMASMMTRMVDAVGVVSKMSIGMIETIATQLGGDPEDPMVTAIKEGAKAMQILSQGTQAGASRLIPGSQRQPPPPKPQQARPPQQAQPQRPAQPRPAPRPPPPAGATATGPQAPPSPGPAPAAPPPPVVATPAPIGVPQQDPFEDVSVGVKSGESFAGIEEAAPPEEPAPLPENYSTVDLLISSIRGLQDPEQIAQSLVSLIKKKDPALSAELDAAGGDPSRVLGEHLGLEFVSANKDYLEDLGSAFEKHADAAGLLEAAEGEPPAEPPPEQPAF